jgi:hypothetical protein
MRSGSDLMTKLRLPAWAIYHSGDLQRKLRPPSVGGPEGWPQAAAGKRDPAAQHRQMGTRLEGSATLSRFGVGVLGLGPN